MDGISGRSTFVPSTTSQVVQRRRIPLRWLSDLRSQAAGRGATVAGSSLTGARLRSYSGPSDTAVTTRLLSAVSGGVVDEQGYSGTKAADIVGITYRQLDYWARTDLVRPS